MTTDTSFSCEQVQSSDGLLHHKRLHHLGKLLWERREGAGFTREELAAEIQRINGTKTNVAQVRRIELGEIDTKASVLVAFALLVELPLEQLAHVLYPQHVTPVPSPSQPDDHGSRAEALLNALVAQPMVCDGWLRIGEALLHTVNAITPRMPMPSAAGEPSSSPEQTQMEQYSIVGRMLAGQRIRAGLNRTEVAVAIRKITKERVTVKQIRCIERGNHLPSVAVLLAFARCVGLSPTAVQELMPPQEHGNDHAE